MSVEPPSDATSGVVAPGAAATTVPLDVPTVVVKPPARQYFPMYRSDVELVLMKYLHRIKGRDWTTPTVTLLTILLTKATATFHDVEWMSASGLATIYTVAGSLCVARLLWLAIQHWRDPLLTVKELAKECTMPPKD